jgi:hypothetical protein
MLKSYDVFKNSLFLRENQVKNYLCCHAKCDNSFTGKRS